MLNKKFRAKLQKSRAKGGWTNVVWPRSVEFFGILIGVGQGQDRWASVSELVYGDGRRDA